MHTFSKYLKETQKRCLEFFLTLIKLPQTIRKRLHSIFGHAVRSRRSADSTHHASHVDHSPFGQTNQWQEGTRHVDHPHQVDGQNVLPVLIC